MNIAKPIRWSILLLVGALLSFAPSARAGTVALQDSAHVFGPGDADALRTVASSAPFDVRVATTTAYADQSALSRFTKSLVNEPDMIAIAIDPEHRHVQVHFSTGSRIPAAQWSSIERAGNDAFKRGAWEQGSADIIRAAEGAVTPGASTESPATSGGHSFLWVLFLLVPLIVIVLVIVAIVALVRRFQRPNTWMPGNQGPYGGGQYGGGGPNYGYGGGQPGGIGPVGGGLIGAGLGGVAGYELGKMEGEREQRERDQGGDFGGGGGNYGANYGGDGGGSSNYDAGGDGSSWDSGSSGDSGSGGDFGGGDGGDSGGGGDSF